MLGELVGRFVLGEVLGLKLGLTVGKVVDLILGLTVGEVLDLATGARVGSLVDIDVATTGAEVAVGTTGAAENFVGADVGADWGYSEIGVTKVFVLQTGVISLTKRFEAVAEG